MKSNVSNNFDNKTDHLSWGKSLNLRLKRKLFFKKITQIVYICQSLSFLFGISAIIGVFINYIKREEVRGSWLESHFIWQIRTFWFGMLFGIIGWILSYILIGFLVLAVNLVWMIFRVVKGWLLLYEDKPISNPYSFM